MSLVTVPGELPTQWVDKAPAVVPMGTSSIITTDATVLGARGLVFLCSVLPWDEFTASLITLELGLGSWSTLSVSPTSILDQ